MPATFDPVLMIILAYFTVFIAGLAYAQWTTRGLDVKHADR